VERVANDRRVWLTLACAAVLLWALVPPPLALASCVPMTEAEQRDGADVIFDGRALPGRHDEGLLFSPARFEVVEYSKGDGPRIVEVMTAIQDEGGGLRSTFSEGITPRAGETWRIYAERPPGDVPLMTSVCAGSMRIAGASPSGTDGDGTDGDGTLAGGEVEDGRPRAVFVVGAMLALVLVGSALHRSAASRRVRSAPSTPPRES
jgi:hypothetical protein